MTVVHNLIKVLQLVKVSFKFDSYELM